MRRGKGGPLTVVEYSELDQSLASVVNQQTGRLRFCWSNVWSVFHVVSGYCRYTHIFGVSSGLSACM